LYLLEQVAEWVDWDSHRARVVCVLEQKEGSPQQGEWVDIQAISSRPFSIPEHGQLVRQALHKLEEKTATFTPHPWRYRGWFEQAVQWIKQELSRLGYGTVIRIEQGKANDNSAILRANTEQDVFYFKAVADLPRLANEPIIAATLVARYPHLIPSPICTDPARRWMLTAAFGPTLEDPERDRDLLIEAVHLYGQMQLDSAAHTAELMETDLFGYNLDELPTKVETLLQEQAVVELLEPDEVSALHLHLPLLHEYIDRLATSPIPQTIVHGDFAIHNIAQHNGKPLVFDWTQAGISFPFFDMVELLRYETVEAIQSQLKAAYLSAWTERASLAELEDLWKMAEPLGFLVIVLHFRAIAGDSLPLGEPRPYFLRRMLRSIEKNKS